MRRARKGEIDVGPITPIYLNRTLGLSGCLNGLEFEVAIDIHNDYHTLCFRAFPLANDAAGYTCEEFKKAALLLKKLSEHGDDKASGHGASSLELLYEDFWDRFEDSIKNNEFKEFSYQGAREAVFRGIILRTVKLKEQLQIHSRGPLAPNSTRNGPDSYVINTDFPKPNEKTPRPSSKALQPTSDQSQPLNTAVFESLQRYINNHNWFFGNFFGYGENPAWILNTRPTNSVLTTLANGLALYGSDIGAQRTDLIRSPNRQTRFFVVFGGNSREQLGRILRSLLYCGEMRISALKYYGYIRRKRRSIIDLRKHYDDLNGRGALDSDASYIKNQFEETEERFYKILDAESDIPKYVERSSFYFRNLDRYVSRLRECRIIGWQTYADFIYEKLGPHSETIRMMGRDLDAMFEARERVERRIVRQETSLANERAHSITADVKAEIEFIRNLQNAQTRSSKMMVMFTLIIVAMTSATLFPLWMPENGADYALLLYLAAIFGVPIFLYKNPLSNIVERFLKMVFGTGD
jgi:hypothetical protein